MSISDILGLSSDLLVDLTTLLSPYNVDTVPALCDIYIVVKMTLMNTANMFIVLMSVERVYATYYPFRYKQNVTLGLIFKAGLFCLIPSFMSSFSVVATQGAVDGYCFDTRKGVSSLLVTVVVAKTTILFNIIPSVAALILNVLISMKINQRTRSSRLLRYFNLQPKYIEHTANIFYKSFD